MEKIQLIDRLSVVEPERGYWFIRTDDGINFDPFTKNGFIGIGWNPITLEDLTKLSPQDAHQKIAKTYSLDLELTKNKRKVSDIYNKLIRFKDIKKGDVVVVPSNASGRLAFGIIEDSNIYIDTEQSHECDYYKRKKVDWVLTKNADSLDPILYKIKISRHSISSIKPYQDYIDRIISTFYFKDNFGNFVFEVNKDEDINLSQLVDLISSIQKLLFDINKFYQYGENIEDCAIKLSLQSRGKFTLKEPIGRSLATFGIIIALYGCQNDNNQTSTNLSPQERQKAEQFIATEVDTLKNIDKRFVELEVNKDKINSVFR